MKPEYQKQYDEKLLSLDDAAKLVRSGDRVYVGTCTSIAYGLCRALGKHMEGLKNITILCSNINKPLKITDGSNPEFRISSYFMGAVERAGVKKGITDYTSYHLSQVDRWVKETAKPTVSFLEVSPPDEDGYFSFGASGVCLNTYLLECPGKIVLQVNRCAPYVCGESDRIHISQADYITEYDEDLFSVGDLPITPDVEKISQFLIDEIHDGDCIQFGIGGLANAVGYGLKHKNDLGCHTELIGDSLKYLMERGNITNRRKGFKPGKTTVSFALGSKALYKYLDRNEDVYFVPMPVGNNPANIALNDNMVSINSALSVDLLGQVVADNIDGVQYSGVGGQIDFMRGAQMSRGGRSYLALTSTYGGGKGSRICARLNPGAIVTTPRSEVQYVVTEYGCIDLKALTMRERAQAMISLAHPDFRAELTKEAKQFGLI